MHEHLYRFSLAIVASKLAFLAIVFSGTGGWPGWVLAAEGALMLGLGMAGLVLARRARRDARWEGVLT